MAFPDITSHVAETTSSPNLTMSAPELPPPLTEFTFFPKLAPELRVKIWTLALRGTITIHLQSKCITKKRWSKKKNKMTPAVLQLRFHGLELNNNYSSKYKLGISAVCIEARAEYIKTFPYAMKLKEKVLGDRRILRFGDEDKIYITERNDGHSPLNDQPGIWGYIESQGWGKDIKSLGIELHFANKMTVETLFRVFSSLAKLDIACESPKDWRGDENSAASWWAMAEKAKGKAWAAERGKKELPKKEVIHTRFTQERNRLLACMIREPELLL